MTDRNGWINECLGGSMPFPWNSFLCWIFLCIPHRSMLVGLFGFSISGSAYTLFWKATQDSLRDPMLGSTDQLVCRDENNFITSLIGTLQDICYISSHSTKTDYSSINQHVLLSTKSWTNNQVLCFIHYEKSSSLWCTNASRQSMPLRHI